METLETWLETEILPGNPVWRFVAFVVAVALTAVAAKSVQILLGGRLRRIAEATQTRLDDELVVAAEQPAMLLVGVLGLRASLFLLRLPEFLDELLHNVLVVVMTVFVTWLITRSLDALRRVFVDPFVEATETKLDDQLVPIADKTIKATLWSMAILIAFSNLGYDVLSLLTGLGIGGLAVAMAAQATLSNVVGSVTIFADQPFQVEDLITVGEHTGVVREVGLRAVRIRTLQGALVNIPNHAVVDSPVVNLSTDGRWRHDVVLAVVYDTTADQLEGAIAALKQVLAAHPAVDDDFAVRLKGFADSAIELSLAFYVSSPSPAKYLDTISEVNLAIKRRFEADGFTMAFPSLSLYLERSAAVEALRRVC